MFDEPCNSGSTSKLKKYIYTKIKEFACYKAVKLPGLFPGAPLTSTGATRNIQGNLDRYSADSTSYMHSLGIFYIYIRLTVEIFVTYTQPFIFDWWIDILERQSVSETVSPSERFETPVFVDHFSYQDKTFPVPCFRILDLAVTPLRSRDLIWSDNMFLQLQLQQDLLDKNIQGTSITYASISVSGDPY